MGKIFVRKYIKHVYKRHVFTINVFRNSLAPVAAGLPKTLGDFPYPNKQKD